MLNNVSKRLEKKYKIKRIRFNKYIVRESYIFELYFNLIAETNTISWYLSVKPIFVDDLFWKILGRTSQIKPFSMRVDGSHAVPSILIDKFQWQIDGDTGYEDSNLERLFDIIFSTIIQSIDSFIKENPNSDIYTPFLNKNKIRLTDLLILCQHHRYKEVLDLVNTELSKGNRGIYKWHMPDGSFKGAYDYIKSYCLNQLKPDGILHS